MELLSPAGSLEKLFYAYSYGADAAYIGLKHFSLRAKAENFLLEDAQKVSELKKQFPEKKLFCTLNISFHENDIAAFKNEIEFYKQFPIDAFIIQDLGLLSLLQKEFPNVALHLSTQANCINSFAAKLYKSLGFSRIVLGREASLSEIREIKNAVPEMELEAFCHGAMCIAYSGRCLMSAYLTGRSAQAGECAHTCRWNFSVSENAKTFAESGVLQLEEEKRRGEFFPVYEGDNFTAVLSSKDINMIYQLRDMKDAGLTAIKIEGRMKSVYYVALVTRAYRKALDALSGKIANADAKPFIDEMENVPHRESTTGFYYDKNEADKTTSGESVSDYELAASIQNKLSENEIEKLFEKAREAEKVFFENINALHPEAKKAKLRDLESHPEKIPHTISCFDNLFFYHFTALNKFDVSENLEFVSPDIVSEKIAKGLWFLLDAETGILRDWAFGNHECVLCVPKELPEAALIRVRTKNVNKGNGKR